MQETAQDEWTEATVRTTFLAQPVPACPVPGCRFQRLGCVGQGEKKPPTPEVPRTLSCTALLTLLDHSTGASDKCLLVRQYCQTYTRVTRGQGTLTQTLYLRANMPRSPLAKLCMYGIEGNSS